jgi:transcriptional regulator GlxA family with amidase domain
MKRIGVIVFPGFGLVDLALIPVFELANLGRDAPAYEIEVLSEHGGPVMSSAGVQVDSKPFGGQAFDTVAMTGAITPEPTSAGVIAYLQAACLTSRRVASICTGARALADAGILDGRRCTTHWGYGAELQRLFPKVRVDADRIYVADGPIWTSAGMTAGIDMALAMVESDLGADVSRAIARKLVVYHRRAGGQSQFSALLELQPKSDRIQDALTFAKNNLKKRLSIAELAEAANLSTRQFSRAFRAETGKSPARAVENLRVEAARTLLESGSHPVEVVARESGFADPERMRRAFLRAFGQPPQAIRRGSRQPHEATSA